ncbi:MAG: bifunctional folylpolyglutamate synthase/dihydrofolate synthase [Anaerolineae bacterium]|nr:bifunctional folylpolyglutamate synthase/dihydrofolate synthase [Anaerolineae bacterium]
MPLTYQQALDYIHSFDDPYLAAMRDHGKQTWGLATVEALLESLGDPHLAYPTIHVAGTKGKGSTAAFIAHALVESGLKTGLYSSPHLQDWRERIQIDGEWIPESALADLVGGFHPHAARIPDLSAFEAATALAFWYFAREDCDVAVIEVGLGGRLDATSVVKPLVSVITSLSLDHTQLLGTTLAEIAVEKVAIIKPGTPVVSAPQFPEALDVIEKRVVEMGSSLVLVGRDWLAEPVASTFEGSEVLMGELGRLEAYNIGLPGAFQIENAAVAAAALREAQRAGLAVTTKDIRAGLLRAWWPGRFEKIFDDPLVILDSAHNPYSVKKLVEALKALVGERSLTFVFGCMVDKDVEGMLRAILSVAHRVIFTQVSLERAASAQDLLAKATEIAAAVRRAEGDTTRSAQIELSAFPTIAEAVTYALGQVSLGNAICIAGSLAVAGEARTMLLAQNRGIVRLSSTV